MAKTNERTTGEEIELIDKALGIIQEDLKRMGKVGGKELTKKAKTIAEDVNRYSLEKCEELGSDVLEACQLYLYLGQALHFRSLDLAQSYLMVSEKMDKIQKRIAEKEGT